MNRNARFGAALAFSVVAGLVPLAEPLGASARGRVPEDATPTAARRTVGTPSRSGLPPKPNIVLITADDMRPSDLKASARTACAARRALRS